MSTQAQCNIEATIVICDMTQIDYDNDGTFDGIINLYDEYTNLTGDTIEAGTWFDPGFNFALVESTGDLFLWDLNESSTSNTDYQFQLTNSTCGSDVALTINLVLGAFSGVALPTNLNDVNIQVCDEGSTPTDLCVSLPDMDLYEALESLPSPHSNGEWFYEGSSPNFIEIIDSDLYVTIPYSDGPPLVDEETFELVYRVEGIAPCDLVQETRIKVSVVREVFSGLAQNKRICESSILNGDYDNNIDLRDDEFLLFEDSEGTWEMDMFGEITSLGDSSININSIYQQIINSNPRFGCIELDFKYSVDQRSGVCDDSETIVSFKLYEYLRPFSQPDAAEFCEYDPLIPATINLYDQLIFANENGVVYDYPSDSCTQWSFVSGPSDLGLVGNDGGCTPSVGYSYLGPVSLVGAEPGTYIFEYTVDPEVNCGIDDFQVINYTDACTSTFDASTGLCNSESAQVIIVINPENYAGEDTIGLEFCESSFATPVDLITLLNTNGIQDPIYSGPLGVWSDAVTNDIINNPFTIPEINGQQTFSFVYSTTAPGNCTDTANLTFTVYEEYQAGNDKTISVCSDEAVFNLFDELDGNPNSNGTWAGPNGFVSTTNDVNFDPSLFEQGDYFYTVPNNGNGADLICSGSQAIITVVILDNANAGSDMDATVCKSDLQVDLLDLLDDLADTGGVFVDSDMTNALTGNIVDVTILDEGSYDFQYNVQSDPMCSISSSIITLTVIDVESPIAQNQTFCVTDAATISDLEVFNSGETLNVYDTATSTNTLSEDLLLANGEDYYLSALDINGCESVRIQITVTVLPFADPTCDGCEINDGISDNNDNENEVLDLCNLPIIFPDFTIEIFNRYGVIVFKGNRNTSLFDGTSNVSLTIGNRLPSGTYFYIFNPNDGIEKPFQGSVYLSR
ncbi:hypothetical protein FBALC1_13832 [Flavobacteriales bacterium ALC-1]|nr:hypothetical protein FBALC1_13832 [Flavobacteriales bacterium ALC-1]